jgi:hypothetical protein
MVVDIPPPRLNPSPVSADVTAGNINASNSAAAPFKNFDATAFLSMLNLRRLDPAFLRSTQRLGAQPLKAALQLSENFVSIRDVSVMRMAGKDSGMKPLFGWEADLIWMVGICRRPRNRSCRFIHASVHMAVRGAGHQRSCPRLGNKQLAMNACNWLVLINK